jgi:all-trans-retinol 13,14-reductase
MQSEMYDVVIVGSGLGGLLCANFLSNEGYSVCVLEKNRQLGGSLQTFVRDRCIFDTGVHYVGGLEKGQALHKIFTYLGFMHKLKLQPLNEEGFDRTYFEGEEKFYVQSIGYDRFVKNLIADFPNEALAINTYVDTIQHIVKQFPLYNLEHGASDFISDMPMLSINAAQFINTLTQDLRLRAVLATPNVLYAGEADKSPLYMHALVINTYILSSHRFVDGSSQLERLITKNIRNNKSKVINRAKVVKLEVEDEQMTKAILQDGREIEGKLFISAIHPSPTLDMISSNMIRKSYRNRIKSLENTASCFILNLVFKKNTFPYKDHNIYHMSGHDAWGAINYTQENWPHSFAFYCCAHSKATEYAENGIAIAYMRYDEMKEWENTYNTTSEEDDRGEAYQKFKVEKAEKLLDRMEKLFPNIREQLHSYYASTPLTYRDYIGTHDGSLYGILKDCNDPIKSFVAVKTKIPNLLMTGQNLHTHGVYGVAIAAIKTCSEILGHGYLIDKIQLANEE